MPTFGYVKLPPISLAEAKAQFDKKHTWSIGYLIAQYTLYLNANEHQHHYNGCETKEDWLALSINIYLKAL